jgi:hypothetical protein
MRIRILYTTIALVGLAACTPDHPFDKEGTWSLGPQGSMNSNTANLRAMIVNPNDLVIGQSEPGSLGAEAACPVKRLFAGKRAKLPQIGTIQLQVGGDQNSQQQTDDDPCSQSQQSQQKTQQ